MDYKKKHVWLKTSPLRRAFRKFLEIVLARLPSGRYIGALPGFKAYYSAKVLARRDHTGLHSGVYETRAQALAAIPPSRQSGWDLDEAATLWVDQIDPVRASSYPTFFWLLRLLKPDSAIVDLGGSIGLTYYGYRCYADLPAGTSWTVIEVPKICAQGSVIAQREAAGNLHFKSALDASIRCDLLLCAGALQYFEHSIPGLLEQFAAKPRHILLTKLPVYDMPDCWTLQNYGPGVTPQRLFNETVLLEYFSESGYRVRDRWDVPDLDCLIPFHPELYIHSYSSFLFELREQVQNIG